MDVPSARQEFPDIGRAVLLEHGHSTTVNGSWLGLEDSMSARVQLAVGGS